MSVFYKDKDGDLNAICKLDDILYIYNYKHMPFKLKIYCREKKEWWVSFNSEEEVDEALALLSHKLKAKESCIEAVRELCQDKKENKNEKEDYLDLMLKELGLENS